MQTSTLHWWATYSKVKQPLMEISIRRQPFSVQYSMFGSVAEEVHTSNKQFVEKTQ